MDVDRRMKYPYTLTAKVWYFPYRYYMKHSWLLKYWPVGFFLTIPVMMKITQLVNGPDNVAKWTDIRKKMYAGEH